MKRIPTFIGALAIAGLSAAALGATAVSAHDSTSPRFTTITKAIATKFNLSETEVQSVVDETMTKERESRQAEMKATMETKLSQLVSDGKLTEAQKTALVSKLEERRAAHEAAHTATYATEAERKAAMDKVRSDFETWAKEQGIDLSLIQPERGPGHGRGGFKGGRPLDGEAS